ncbi:transketolase family protein [Lentzea aerocolonigenes]|uniref:transketolase family protein n=1 Tax=Lentzea aerocolonigenes TaxID=68170 RepID=UPI00055A2877|nr:transketolase C-terminal domain-containing protein [Lentzea aerocolonigenes]MCP2241866.1 transketolase [Lentzea aerocolonigenes]
MSLDTWVSEHGTSSRTTCRVAQLDLARSDDRVYSLENDLALPSVPFGKEFPDRYRQIGIAEANLLGVASGLAQSGRIPYVNTFAVFASMRACEQMRVDLSYPKANVKVVGYYTGLSGGFAGPTHHCTEDIAVTTALPGFTVLSPADAYEAYLATQAAASVEGPVYLRASRGDTPMVYSSEYPFEIGKAVTLCEGSDVTIIATGCLVVPRAVEVASRLASRGISCRVLNMHTLKPLDVPAIVAAARETGLIVTYEDHNLLGGLGSAVAAVVLENEPVPVLRFGVPDVFCTRSDEYEEILDLYGLGVHDVYEAVMRRLR